MSSELGHPLPPVLADGDGTGAPYSSPPWTSGLSTSLSLQRGRFPCPRVSLRAQGPVPLQNLETDNLRKQIRLGMGLGPFTIGLIGDGGLDICLYAFDLRTSWVGVLTVSDRGEGFGSSWKK